MSLTLSSTELTHIQAALQTLLSPLASSSVDEWRAAVNRSLRELLQADKAMFILQAPGVPLVYSDEFTKEEVEEYEEILPSDHGKQMLQAQGIEVWSHTRIISPDPDIFFKSWIYDDFYKPRRLEDGIGYCIDYPEDQSFAVVKLHQEWYGAESYGDRGITMLQMLLPAFKAGVKMHLQLARHRMGFARTLDALREAVLLCDASGRVLHQNAALIRALQHDSEGERLVAEMERLGRSLAGLAATPIRHGDEGVERAGTRQFRTQSTRYRLHGSYVGGDVLGAGSGVLVTLERLTPEFPEESSLQERFGLSKKEAQVAVLLAQGRSNEEVAAALFISPHTARHHSEQVRLKLGVRSRAEVGARILVGG